MFCIVITYVLRTNSDFCLIQYSHFEVNSVYSAVRTESLCNTERFRVERVNIIEIRQVVANMEHAGREMRVVQRSWNLLTLCKEFNICNMIHPVVLYQFIIIKVRQ